MYVYMYHRISYWLFSKKEEYIYIHTCNAPPSTGLDWWSLKRVEFRSQKTISNCCSYLPSRSNSAIEIPVSHFGIHRLALVSNVIPPCLRVLFWVRRDGVQEQYSSNQAIEDSSQYHWQNIKYAKVHHVDRRVIAPRHFIATGHNSNVFVDYCVKV